MPAGRPTSCTPEVIEEAWKYIGSDKKTNYESHNHVVPSVEGMAIVINRARSSVYLWAEDKDNEFSDILEEIKSKQHFELANKGLAGDTQAVITKLMLTKHGYSDKQEIRADVNDYSDKTAEELDRIIREKQQQYQDSLQD